MAVVVIAGLALPVARAEGADVDGAAAAAAEGSGDPDVAVVGFVPAAIPALTAPSLPPSSFLSLPSPAAAKGFSHVVLPVLLCQK